MTKSVIPADQLGHATADSSSSYPGRVLGIVAIPVAIIASAVGIVLGFIASRQSKAVGVWNSPARMAILIGFVMLGATIITGVVVIVGTAELISTQCHDRGFGTESDGGLTVACP